MATNETFPFMNRFKTSEEVDLLKSQLNEFKSALETSRRQTGEANRERDRQCEEKLELLAKYETLQKREKRMEEHLSSLENRLLNSSGISESGSEAAEEKHSLQSVRFGLEMARQQLSALSARYCLISLKAIFCPSNTIFKLLIGCK